MFEQEVMITTNHGRMPAFTVCPSEEGQWPTVLFYMDAPGIRPELYNMARRIAKQGYYCILPDIYYRLGTVRFDGTRREDTMSAVIKQCVQHAMDQNHIVDDTGAMIAFADAQAQVKPGPVGAVGYCMGGPFITWAAAHYPERIKGAASLYGVRLIVDHDLSPHKLVHNVTGELYFGFAEEDKSAPPEVIEEFTKIMADAGVKHQVEILPGTKHGFCFPERGVYVPAAAERTWERMFDLWERTLK